MASNVIINLDEYEDVDLDSPGGITIPDGYYTAKVLEASHETGEKDHVALSLKITEGEYSGSTIKSWMYLHTPDCERITLETLSRLGTPPRWNPANAKQLVGKECRIKVEKEEGRQFSSVKSIYQRDIPSGQYETVITKVEQDINTNGKQFLRMIFTIKNEGEYQNLNIIENWYLSDKAAKWTAGKLKRLGLSGGIKPSNLATLIGKKVKLNTIVTLGSNGRKNTNVQNLELMSGDTTVISINDDDIDGIDIVSTDPDDFDAGFEDEIPF